MTTVIDLTPLSFDEVVAASSVPVLVDFWAEWCGPCHKIAPVLEALATDLDGQLRVCKVDVEAHPELAQRFGVMSFPSLLVFREGELLTRMVGARGRNHLLEELDPLISG